MSRVRVTIDRIVLNGFEADQGRALVAGLEGELTRMLGDPAARADAMRSLQTPVLRLGGMSAGPGPAGGRRLGRSVAGAIGRSLKP